MVVFIPKLILLPVFLIDKYIFFFDCQKQSKSFETIGLTKSKLRGINNNSIFSKS